MLLCLSMALAIGGGLYEHLVLTPLWSASPPSSFAIIQPGTGVPLQKFWIPVHTAITTFLILSLVLTWRQMEVRRLLLIGLSSYIVMRVWSGLYFIREMLAFQKISFVCFLLDLLSLFFYPRLPHVTSCYYNRFLTASRIDQPM